MMKNKTGNDDQMIYNPITKYKTTHNNKGTRRRRVNASLITDLPEIPNRPIGLFRQLAVVIEHALRYEVTTNKTT